MGDQKNLFGFEDMRPKLMLKKHITRERMDEIKAMLDKKNGKSAGRMLRELNDELEKVERRLSNGKALLSGQVAAKNRQTRQQKSNV